MLDGSPYVLHEQSTLCSLFVVLLCRHRRVLSLSLPPSLLPVLPPLLHSCCCMPVVCMSALPPQGEAQQEVECGSVAGELRHHSLRPVPASLLAPDVMGWLAYLPGFALPCRHGIVSLGPPPPPAAAAILLHAVITRPPARPLPTLPALPSALASSDLLCNATLCVPACLPACGLCRLCFCTRTPLR